MAIKNVVSYIRDLSVQGPDKFHEFHKLLSSARSKGAEAVLIAGPKVLGDTYEELITNMGRLAEANLAIVIVPPSQLEKGAAQRN